MGLYCWHTAILCEGDRSGERDSWSTQGRGDNGGRKRRERKHSSVIGRVGLYRWDIAILCGGGRAGQSGQVRAKSGWVRWQEEVRGSSPRIIGRVGLYCWRTAILCGEDIAGQRQLVRTGR